MKFNLVLVFFLSFIVSNCTKDPDPTPPRTTLKIVTENGITWENKNFQPIIYEGDTVKWNFTITADNDISEIKVYKLSNGTKVLVSGYPKTTFTDKRKVYEPIRYPVGKKADFVPFYLVTEIGESNGTGRTITGQTFDKLEEIIVKKDLKVGFNRCMSLNRFYNFTDSCTISFSKGSTFDINSEAVIYPIFNYPIYKPLGISPAFDYNLKIANNKSTFAKLESLNYELVSSATQINSQNSDNKSKMAYLNYGINVGDIYISKLNPLQSDTLYFPPAFAILKITAIYNDNNDYGNYNTQKDYIQFDAKIIKSWRFDK